MIHRSIKLLLGSLVFTASLVMWSTGSAWAANGYVYTQGNGGETQYVDNGDTVSVCDLSVDGHGVIGWIAIQQANGSYADMPHIYDGDGADTCKMKVQNVTRESSNVAIHACLVDGASGTPYNCQTKVVSGN